MEYKAYTTLPNWKLISIWVLFLFWAGLYIMTGDYISSLMFVLIMGLLYGIAGYILSKKPIIINDEGIKIRDKIYRWEDIKCIIVCPNKYIIIQIRLPERIHRVVGTGIRVRSSDITEYMIKYDKNIIKLFNDKIKNKMTYADYWDFDKFMKSLKK